MPQIFLSARAVATILLDDVPTEHADVPRLYKTSSARLASKRNITLEGWEAATNKVRPKL
jgi:hypothetical protein